MATSDWIVVGGGITGASLAYELTKRGASVCLVEQFPFLQGATRFSYGGIAFWSGTTELTRQLCAEGIARHRALPEELGKDTQFQELDLLLTIAPDRDPQAVASIYQNCAIPPQPLTVEEAWELEPLLNPAAISGGLTVRHGHVSPEACTQAYLHGLQVLGGKILIEPMVNLVRQGDRVTGVVTPQGTHSADNIAICAGGISRALLKAAGIPLRVYFTHSELLETPPVDFTLRTLVMPAENQRFRLESTATQEDAPWVVPGNEPVPPILDAGAIQFRDRQLRIGQISRVLTDPNATIDAIESETAIRTQVGQILPGLKELPATWHHCLIAFSSDSLPVVGAIPGLAGIHVFTGFSNPFAIIPAVAQRFAAHTIGQEDPMIAQLSPARFQAT